MKQYPADCIRNIGMFAHGGAGKTSLTEACLFASKATTRLGKVEEGNTVTDYGALGAFYVADCASLAQWLLASNVAKASATYPAQWAIRLFGDAAHLTEVAELVVVGNMISKAAGPLYFGLVDSNASVKKHLSTGNSWSNEAKAFPANDATPSVNKYGSWVTANSSSTTITYFDDTERGDTWLVDIQDSLTTIACAGGTGTNLINSAGASNISPGYGDVLRCTNLNGTKILVERIDL